ncbi:hypothetical protein G9A89_010055 [Geosiphon pyriformis]|nr:hypothetical protein G9A89_010055 [Geosiphon pyriformis]
MEIQPAYAYDAENGGRVPVFKPTIEEFQDFNAFVTAISKYGKETGIVKIIPPKEWSGVLPDLTERLQRERIKHPIEQVFSGSKGIYRQDNLEMKKSYTLKQWRKICESPEHRPPRRNNQQQKQLPTPPQKKRKLEAQHSEKTKATNNNETEVLSGPNNNDKGHPVVKKTNFDYRIHNQVLYTDEYCKELERDYWRNLPFNSSFYGADMIGSLFDPKITKTWNVNQLDNLLNRINVSIPGVNRAYLYFGMWKATFAWHVEDMDLYSINYIHFGAPKQWYAIPPPYGKKFENVMRGYFQPEFQACREYLRHKQFIVKPSILAENNIPVNYLVQREGEFVITFPYGYHAGYNLDYNCAESVNFALQDWVPIGKKAGSCRCQNDSVKIDVASFFEDLAPRESTPPKPRKRLILLPSPPSEKRKSESKKHKHIESSDYYEYPGSPSPEYMGPDSPRHHSEDEDYLEEDNSRKFLESVKKPMLRIVHRTQKIQCMLCPIEGGQLFRTQDDGFAHALCASFVPETHIAPIDDMGTERVIGIHKIPQARWNLKCEICKTKNGACIQCIHGKCVKAFHPYCAHKANFHLQQRITLNGEFLYEGFCKLHDPRLLLEKKRKIAELSALVQINRDVWAKTYGSYYKGKIIEKDEETQKCKIMFRDGYARTISWTLLHFTDPTKIEETDRQPEVAT